MATVLLAMVAFAIGLAAGSSAIVFDGVYGIIDAIMTMLALVVARLIAASNAADARGQNFSQRFTFGFWHLEPIVLGLNGTLLIDAIGVILAGRRALSFDLALIHAGIGTILDIGIAVTISRANRVIRSDLVALDAKAWSMTAALGSALFVAFLIGHVFKGTRYAWGSPYVDPVALLLICLAIIPVPFATIRKALSEILLVTLQDIKDEIDRVASDIVSTRGFVPYHAFVARSGRGIQIELNIVVPKDQPARQQIVWRSTRPLQARSPAAAPSP